MKKSKERIYIQQWLDLKPYKSQAPTDRYYLNLCNQVKKTMNTDKHSFVFQVYLNNAEIDLLACFITSYFEDLISETNIWNTFIKIHQREYEKYLPFYEIEGDYYEKEINLHDICFLTWYFLTTVQQDSLIFPLNDFIIETARKVMKVFENAWEHAPENEVLQTFYAIDEAEEDFYKVRNLIDIILFQTYLFYPDTLFDTRESELELIEERKDDEYLLDLLHANRNYRLHNSHTRLLGLKGQEWVAEILGENHRLSKDILNMSKQIVGLFFYKGQDNENIFLEHVASGMKFNLVKKSYDHSENLIEVDTLLTMGIAQWKNEWWFSGISLQNDFNPDLVLDEKNSIHSRSAVNFLEHKDNDLEDMLDKQFKAFKKFNNNQPIAFMASGKIDAFIDDYMAFFNDSLDLSQKEREQADQRARDDGFFAGEDEMKFSSDELESGLVFFNPKNGIEVALEINSAFPMKNNSFYNEDESEEHIMHLFFEEDYSAELVLYCIDNFKQDLKFFNSTLGKLYLDNMDFLLRFWKREHYFSSPRIAFIG